MCGIFGVYHDALSDQQKESFVKHAFKSLSARGPDSNGVWLSDDGSLVLGHTRLAILELTAAGHQPMVSDCGRYVLTFNGEIYNHSDIRSLVNSKEKAGKWRGHSDTETILRCFGLIGVRDTLSLMSGMFALALWDKKLNKLFLARDRLGEKPLYWGEQNGRFVFSSDLDVFKGVSGFSLSVDRGVLCSYLRYGYVPAPYSIYKGVYKLKPGSFMEISFSESKLGKKHEEYWSAAGVIKENFGAINDYSDEEAIDSLENLLFSSVKQQMIADVPLGAFLSGGIDSTAVVAMMVNASSSPVRTYAIGFEDPQFDEAAHAASVAKALGTDHTELYVTGRDALDIIPSLSDVYTEPFSDSSQIPTCLVSKMARAQVTVALSGDGGDELFGGYTPYLFMPKYWSLINKLPISLRKLAAPIARSISVPDRMLKLAEVMAASNKEKFYKDTVSLWVRPEEIIKNANEMSTVLDEFNSWPSELSYQEWMMFIELIMYMPDDVLVKVDRASMAHGLETRVPLLDHKIVEFSLRLPLSMKIRSGQGKWILRQLVYRHVAKEIIDRPKKGFSVPIANWLRNELKDWAENLLDEGRLQSDGYFNTKLIRAAWTEHKSLKRDHSKRLWAVLMFQAWLHKGV